MTALVILGILACVIVVVLTACYMNIKQLKNNELTKKSKAQAELINEIDEKAMQYGYSEPLAYDIIRSIQTYRKENS